MIRDIFVIVMCVVALAAGAWCWWLEHHGKNDSDER